MAPQNLFVGRLHKNTRKRDLEKIFEYYGKLSRCDIKYGSGTAYAFVDFEDARDAEDALKYENGRDVLGNTIVVEYAKGPGQGRSGGGGRGGYGGGGSYGGGYGGRRGGGGYGDRGQSRDECYKCRRSGHWARDCPELRAEKRNFGRGRSRSRSRSNDRYEQKTGSRSRSRSS